MKSTDKERKEITKSLVESISNVIVEAKKTAKAMNEYSGYDGNEVGLGVLASDSVWGAKEALDTALDELDQLDSQLRDVEDVLKQEKVKTKTNIRQELRKVKTAFNGIGKYLKEAERETKKIDKKRNG